MKQILFIWVVCLFLEYNGVTGQACSETRKYARIQQDPTCRTYDECINGQRVVSYCPSGQLFYELMQQCVVDGSYTCGQTNLTVCNGIPEGDVADPTDCTRYYMCTNGIPLRRNCEAGYVFDPEDERCVFQTGSITCRQSNNIYQCPSPGNGQFADAYDPTCRAYYNCNNYQATRATCSSNMLFYPELKQCVIYDSYRCGGFSFRCPSAEGDYADPANANNFYHCTKGYPLLRRCKAGEVFNTQLVRCSTQGSNVVSRCSAVQLSCSNVVSGNYSDGSDPTCRSYIDCRNYQAVRVSCPQNFLYYPGLKKCVLPDSYRCNDPSPFQCTQENADFPDTQNCRRYYYCNKWCPLHRTCTSNYIFNGNSNVKRCVDPSTYSCPYPII